MVKSYGPDRQTEVIAKPRLPDGLTTYWSDIWNVSLNPGKSQSHLVNTGNSGSPHTSTPFYIFSPICGTALLRLLDPNNLSRDSSKWCTTLYHHIPATCAPAPPSITTLSLSLSLYVIPDHYLRSHITPLNLPNRMPPSYLQVILSSSYLSSLFLFVHSFTCCIKLWPSGTAMPQQMMRPRAMCHKQKKTRRNCGPLASLSSMSPLFLMK